jgi:hypothetical protein
MHVFFPTLTLDILGFKIKKVGLPIFNPSASHPPIYPTYLALIQCECQKYCKKYKYCKNSPTSVLLSISALDENKVLAPGMQILHFVMYP